MACRQGGSLENQRGLNQPLAQRALAATLAGEANVVKIGSDLSRIQLRIKGHQERTRFALPAARARASVCRAGRALESAIFA